MPARPNQPDKPWNEVRKEKLERARRLLQDAHYPSEEVVESVADLLARSWGRLRRSHKAGSIHEPAS
jgi:hypothetical protein